MSVPEEIRRVPRPVNTVVADNGKDGPRRYCVRERSGTRYVPGGNPQPRSGKVIGHIVDGKFVPLVRKTGGCPPAELEYGAAALIRSVSPDIESQLMKAYPVQDVYSIMSIASLKVIKPSVTNHRLASEYESSFVSVYYPNTHLSANTAGSLIYRIGLDEHKRLSFYKERANAVMAEHHIAIDGTLKQDTSSVNDLSAFTRKARISGCKEVSVIYAYDIENMEPICAQVFPGNCIDACAYSKFIQDNDIHKGIIISDKGFPPGRIQKQLEEASDLHFITPIRKNDVRIRNNDMLRYQGPLEGLGKEVWYKKAVIKGGHVLYAFKDIDMAAEQEKNYSRRIKAENTYSEADYQKKKDLFGVIVFESDLDLPPLTAYRAYEDRWMLELVFKYYKSDLQLDRTNVQNNYSVIGAEFINFIAATITCRIMRKASQLGLLDHKTFGELIDDLSRVLRKTDSTQLPRSDDQYWVFARKYALEEMEVLGLSIPAKKDEPKKRGRPRKTPVENTPRRPRGRPKKIPVSPPIEQ